MSCFLSESFLKERLWYCNLPSVPEHYSWISPRHSPLFNVLVFHFYFLWILFVCFERICM
ncbi:rCG63414 [Rattus norvegicus]|uniref:RCG63414 n=1 Tax=Rattus norvegicus TaxID=10116 RepID=A6IN01_RAT|nr:rCG63414 [Rattus norvegicus]